ncbi:MAG: hypothetical protein ACP5SH_02195 [Syntrophobacteraceae bacterium]
MSIVLPEKPEDENLENGSCELGGEIFRIGSVNCVGNLCLRCSEGTWRFIFFPIRWT